MAFKLKYLGQETIFQDKVALKKLLPEQHQYLCAKVNHRIRDLNYENLEKYLTEKHIQIRPLFYDIHEHKYLKDISRHSSTILNKTNNGLMLPSYPGLSDIEQEYIITCIKEYIILRNI